MELSVIHTSLAPPVETIRDRLKRAAEDLRVLDHVKFHLQGRLELALLFLEANRSPSNGPETTTPVDSFDLLGLPLLNPIAWPRSITTSSRSIATKSEAADPIALPILTVEIPDLLTVVPELVRVYSQFPPILRTVLGLFNGLGSGEHSPLVTIIHASIIRFLEDLLDLSHPCSLGEIIRIPVSRNASSSTPTSFISA
jgi:hypothetical protein